MGALLARERVGLVYGGGSVGLMGALADAVLENGGEAIGVIPRALWDREIGHRGLTTLHIVDTMHERKATMASLVRLPANAWSEKQMPQRWSCFFRAKDGTNSEQETAFLGSFAGVSS